MEGGYRRTRGAGCPYAMVVYERPSRAHGQSRDGTLAAGEARLGQAASPTGTATGAVLRWTAEVQEEC